LNVPTENESVTERLRSRVHGDAGRPTLVYLPGLHGDWTLVGGFREALGGRVRFIEFTYPRSLSWSLEDYAAAVEEALAAAGVGQGWLLGESFGSQVVWPLLARGNFQIQGIILAGGFVRHPMSWAVPLAERFCASIPLTLLTRILFGYARVARFRFRRSPGTLAGIQEFISRRTELDRQAAVHRIRLVGQSNPCLIAREARVPVHALAGGIDPIVPWFPVRRWLRRHCSRLGEYKILWKADHNVLGTAPKESAQQVLRWMGVRQAKAWM
jgi:pimeloyl-ACP methyl ester carboxylesterase